MSYTTRKRHPLFFRYLSPLPPTVLLSATTAAGAIAPRPADNEKAGANV